MSAFVINPYAFGGFNPASVAGLEIWLDGNDANTLYDAASGGSLTASGGDVKRWEDKSGNNRHFAEAGALVPSRVSSAINGKDAVRFESPSTATIERLTIASGTFSAADFDNCFTVTQSSDTTYVFVTSSSTNGAYINVAQSGSNSGTSSGITIGDRRINGASATNTRNAFFTAMGSTPALVSALNMSAQNAAFANLRLNYSFGGTGEVSDGYLAEMLVYSGTLSTTDRDAIESYLANKWGITI
jgi:hypothetical protein